MINKTRIFIVIIYLLCFVNGLLAVRLYFTNKDLLTEQASCAKEMFDLATLDSMKKISLHYGTEEILLNLPDNAIIYKSNYNKTTIPAADQLFASITEVIDSKPLNQLLQQRKKGNVLIVVSDITRPIPYAEFLPELIVYLEQNGIKKEEIIILIATGMHRASTHQERIQMFGKFIAENYCIIDHDCEKEDELQELDGVSWSGSKVRLNKYYYDASFRIITGLVEPHFMAGFSGGRKSICPGLVALDTLKQLHGYTFLSNPNATTSLLENNPCHDENSSIAQLCPPDFSINVVLDNNKKINRIFSGELFSSHAKTVEYVKSCCCQSVNQEADMVITSSGGYPLDATFYQCVKGFVNVLNAVKTNGEILSFGGCTEGVGSKEYTALMLKYSGKYKDFIEDIKLNRFFIKDQWQFQMQIRALIKVGVENLHFYTSNIDPLALSLLSVNPHPLSIKKITQDIQNRINEAIKLNKIIAVFPQGPYCAPVI